jgi:protein phosphatase
MVDRDKRIISIDGGAGYKSAGQLNAFIIENGRPSWRFTDGFDTIQIRHQQDGSAGSLNITYNDRFIEILDDGEEFSLVRHIESDNLIQIPTNKILKEAGEKTSCFDQATNHFLYLNKGDIVGIVEEYSDRVYAKVEGEAGWIMAEADATEELLMMDDD